MPYYRTCPLCGANNDPGEKCDCQRPDYANPVKYQVGVFNRRKPRRISGKPRLKREKTQKEVERALA